MELVGEYDGAVGEQSNMCIFLGVTLSGEYIFVQRISKKGCLCNFCNTAYLFGLVFSQGIT